MNVGVISEIENLERVGQESHLRPQGEVALPEQKRECSTPPPNMSDEVVQLARPLIPTAAPEIEEADTESFNISQVRDDPFYDEWRRISIPAWRRILQECQGKGDKGSIERGKYAEWMLKEVLKADEVKA